MLFVFGILAGIFACIIAAVLSRKKRKEAYFVLDKDGKGHLITVPKGTDVDGVRLTETDLIQLRDTGELDISDRRNFKIDNQS